MVHSGTKAISVPVEEEKAWFEQKVRECEQHLFRFAFHLTGSVEKSEDLVQEAFLRAFQYRKSYDHDRSFENWIYAILLNVYRQQQKKEKFLRLVLPWKSSNTEDDEEKPWDSLEWEGDGPEELVLKKQVFRDLYAAIEKLPMKMKEIMVLCDVMGHSYEEASEILGCPIGTVRSRLHRARKRVKEKLESVYGEEIFYFWG
ncbi:MAG: RNA polymerase sigma factor [Candidatus Caldatribacteriaceae bacterium]